MIIPIPVTSYPIVARSVVLCDLQGAGLRTSLNRAWGYFVIGIGISCGIYDFKKLFFKRVELQMKFLDFIREMKKQDWKIRSIVVQVGFLFFGGKSFVLAAAEMNVVDNRRQQFLKHQAANEKYEQNRVRGLGDYLDETEKWERKRLAALEAYRHENHGQQEIKEQERRMKLFKFHKIENEEWNEERERARQTFIRQRNEHQKREGLHTQEWARFEIEELDLKDRPRYDIKKRNLSGGQYKGKSSKNSGLGGSSGGNDNYIPPPSNFPSYDSGPYDGGDIPPPPTFPDYDGGPDIPPPPPPPPMPPSGYDGGGDF